MRSQRHAREVYPKRAINEPSLASGPLQRVRGGIPPYARWIPNKGQRWVDLLDRVGSAVNAVKDAMQAQLGTRFGTNRGEEAVRALPEQRKRPKRLVGREGVEPSTR